MPKPSCAAPGSAAALPLEILGELLELHADRALYWPARRALLVADVHLGKAQQLRRAGIGVPEGVTQQELNRLSALLAATDAQRLIVLGDFLHGQVVAGDAWLTRLQAWRQAHKDVVVSVITGNHDRALRRLPLDIEPLGDRHQIGPFQLQHTPTATIGAGFFLCGHIHPVYVVSGQRIPCFVRGVNGLVLPAFSQLAGGAKTKSSQGQQIFACTPEGVFAVERVGAFR